MNEKYFRSWQWLWMCCRQPADVSLLIFLIGFRHITTSGLRSVITAAHCCMDFWSKVYSVKVLQGSCLYCL